VRLVDHQHRAVAPSGLVQVGERSKVPVRGEHRFGHDQGSPPVPAGERRLDRVDVAVRGDHDVGPGKPARVHQGRVVELVRNDQIARSGQRGQDAQVCRVSGGEHQGRGEPEVTGEGILELRVQRGGAGDESAAR
jgi:hypothetical protein